jgi:hypothetical protein
MGVMYGIGTGGGFLWMWYWTFGFHRMRKHFWAIYDLLASQAGLCSKELVSYLGSCSGNVEITESCEYGMKADGRFLHFTH